MVTEAAPTEGWMATSHTSSPLPGGSTHVPAGMISSVAPAEVERTTIMAVSARLLARVGYPPAAIFRATMPPSLIEAEAVLPTFSEGGCHRSRSVPQSISVPVPSPAFHRYGLPDYFFGAVYVPPSALFEPALPGALSVSAFEAPACDLAALLHSPGSVYM